MKPTEVIAACSEFESAWSDSLRVRAFAKLILDTDHGALRNDQEFESVLKGVALIAWIESRAVRA